MNLGRVTMPCLFRGPRSAGNGWNGADPETADLELSFRSAPLPAIQSTDDGSAPTVASLRRVLVGWVRATPRSTRQERTRTADQREKHHSDDEQRAGQPQP